MPLTLATLTIAPRSAMWGSAYFIPRNAPRAFTAMTRSNSASSKSVIGAARPVTPAACTTASIGPSAAAAAVAADVAKAARHPRRSRRAPNVVSVASLISRVMSSARARSASTTRTFAPLLASNRDAGAADVPFTPGDNRVHGCADPVTIGPRLLDAAGDLLASWGWLSSGCRRHRLERRLSAVLELGSQCSQLGSCRPRPARGWCSPGMGGADDGGVDLRRRPGWGTAEADAIFLLSRSGSIDEHADADHSRTVGHGAVVDPVLTDSMLLIPRSNASRMRVRMNTW